ncbi:uncharacterized protein BJ171DRAFT_132518 [Polychytrium aggregatum]|uniref:uncharacterized protein n=1 Tax=Polychytrium aggregatum TaxID=110093 RepID=UPI0022FEEE02|nr:uncharacterized protein BJ171DRAFT_132518 [Polychytrium aggregatum]KAI9203754.1 hypothetical protein BJ171DRAFT_132518 [Polychytrium aggregatum]
MRKRAASNESTLQGSPAKSEAASEPPRPVTRKHVSFMKVTQKQQFVIGVISSGTSGKVKKVQISTRTGASAVVVNLKKWETKRLLTIRDTRPQFSATEYLELYNSDFDINNPKTHSLYPARYVIQTAGVTIAHLEYVNQLKIQISPNYPGAPIYCCTGDFSLGKYIIIIKHPNSREQRFFGECGGRHLLKKSMMDSKVTYYLETEDCENSQLVLSAVCFIAAVTSSFN